MFACDSYKRTDALAYVGRHYSSGFCGCVCMSLASGPERWCWSGVPEPARRGSRFVCFLSLRNGRPRLRRAPSERGPASRQHHTQPATTGAQRLRPRSHFTHGLPTQRNHKRILRNLRILQYTAVFSLTCSYRKCRHASWLPSTGARHTLPVQ